MLVAGLAVWKFVNNLSQKLNYNRVCDRASTIYLIPYIFPSFVLNLLIL